jgi:DNA-binding MarR family transcriptional regulator
VLTVTVIKTLQRVTIAPKQVNMTDIKRQRPASDGATVRVGNSGHAESPGRGAPATPIEGASPNQSLIEFCNQSGGAHVAIVELLFFAYRDFTAAADEILSGYSLGRAHHRVLHFVHRNPGLRVADLLDLLRITKQSLARVLKQLIDEGWIIQQATADDRRVRRLYTTAQGGRLAERLIKLQTERVAAALPGAEAMGIRQFLVSMIDANHRVQVEQLVAGNGATTFAGAAQALRADAENDGERLEIDATGPRSRPAAVTG